MRPETRARAHHRPRVVALAALAACGGAAACASLIGATDIVYDAGDAAPEASADAAPPFDATADAATCAANTRRDPSNCGACGHVCGSAHGSAACVGGACVFTCDEPFAHCLADDFGGCETNLAQVPAHCGACDHDCFAGGCEAGVCEPVVLAAGQSYPSDIAVDDSHVYFSTLGSSPSFADGTVVRADKSDGGSSLAIATAQRFANAVAIDATHVYWVETFAMNIKMAPKVGGPAKVVAQAQDYPRDVAVDSVAVYWVNSADELGVGNTGGSVRRAPKDGGAPVDLALGQKYPYAIAVDGAGAYWANHGWGPAFAGSIERVSLDGGARARIAGTTLAWDLATDGTSLFWTDSYPVGSGDVVELASAGAEAGAIETHENYPSWIAVDAAHVYWTDSGYGNVMRAKRDGSQRILLARGQADPRSVAVDDRYVYWVEDIPSGFVRKVPK